MGVGSTFGSKAEDIFRRILDSPVAAAMIEHQEANLLERRRPESKRLKAIRARQDREAPAKHKALAAAQAQVAEAQRALAAAIAAAQVAAAALADPAGDHEIAQIEKFLRATAPDAIRAFLEDLTERQAAYRRQNGEGRFMRDAFGRERGVPDSTMLAITAWMTRVPDIRRRAEALALEALDADELRRRLAELADELGQVEGLASPPRSAA